MIEIKKRLPSLTNSKIGKVLAVGLLGLIVLAVFAFLTLPSSKNPYVKEISQESTAPIQQAEDNDATGSSTIAEKEESSSPEVKGEDTTNSTTQNSGSTTTTKSNTKNTKTAKSPNTNSSEPALTGFVKKGTLIAYQGDTGCTTSNLLRFIVVLDGEYVNPVPYLNSGQFQWPLKNYTFHQGFGNAYNWWMRNFNLPGSPGIYISEYPGAPIYAAASGTIRRTNKDIVFENFNCVSNSQYQGVEIDHGGGLKTIYGHVQKFD